MITILLAPHQNTRYQASVEQLSRAELEITLRAAGMECAVGERVYAGHTALTVDAPQSPLLDGLLSRLSNAYMVCRAGDDGALYPLYGRRGAYLGDDLSGILKYKGKTNESFTRLLLNVARLSGGYALAEGPLSVLDPVCGKGTTLMEAINNGDNACGIDVDEKALAELQTFMKRYLTYHHFKHAMESGSLTVKGQPKPTWKLTTAAEPAAYKAGDVRTLTAIACDALLADKLLGKARYHMIVGDLPYGVQHATHSGDAKTQFKPRMEAGRKVTIEQFTADALPVWAKLLLPGGAIALSFNSYTLRRDALREQMRACGLDVLEGGPYDGMEHWVEQAVNRDIAVAVKR